MDSKFSRVPLHRRIDWVNSTFLICTTLATIVLVPYCFYRLGWSWPQVLLFIISCGLTELSITAGYHRLFAHRTYETNWWVKLAYLLVGAGAFQASALKWATDHRRHHRFVDKKDDPYNIKKGFLWAHMGWLFVKDNPKYRGQFPSDLADDRLVAWQHRYYIPIAVATGFGVPTLAGWVLGSAFGGLVLSGFLRLLVTNHCTFFINSLCHMVGRQPYTDENSARDSFVMAVFACGEGYHNFHHRFPGDYRNGVRWYHCDPAKWLLSTMSILGWARGLNRTPANKILSARMQMDEKQLLQRGASVELVQPFRLKVEEAQRKFVQLRNDYRMGKKELGRQSREKLALLKAEVRMARVAFKAAWAEWVAYRRALVPVVAY